MKHFMIAIACLFVITACGGSSPTTPANNSTGGNNNGGDNSGGDNSGGDNSGGNNNGGGGGGNPTDCTQTPFHNDCLTNNAPALALRVEDCITDGNAGIARCNTLFTASASNTCLTNPFTDACTSDTEFDDYADDARTNRVSFCASDNTGSSLCTALTTCQTNPFHASCGAYFESAKNPYCETNPTEAPCVVNTADWVAGFDTPPITTGDYTREVYYEFLQGTANGLDFGTIKNVGSAPTIRPLNLESLGGEAKNGVAFFYGGSGNRGSTTPVRLYSGIFSGIDLGAPLTSADASASVPWAGKIGWEYFSAQVEFDSEYNRDFDLTVDFSNSEIRAFVKQFSDVANTDHFLLKAAFDGTGRFDGTIIHATFAGGVEAGAQTKVTNGVVTGIIGKQGAVGAFYGGADDTDNSQGDFTGGFIAVPPSLIVNTADWLAGFDTPPITTGDYTREVYYEFVQATAEGVDFGTIRNGGGDSLPALHTLDFTSLAGEAKNGVAWFEAHSGVNGLELPRRNYSGIFSGTSLGAPLTSADASVTVPWAGKFGWLYSSADGLSSHRSDTAGEDFDLTVDFANSEIRAFVNRTGTEHFLLKATFDSTGRFDGTMNYGAFAGSVDTATPTNVITGVVTGIIGKQGAVGAFYGGADDTDDSQGDFAGGFVAAPPSE